MPKISNTEQETTELNTIVELLLLTAVAELGKSAFETGVDVDISKEGLS